MFNGIPVVAEWLDFDRRRFGQSKDYFTQRKKEDTIQYGEWFLFSCASVFSKTLAHETGKNEIR